MKSLDEIAIKTGTDKSSQYHDYCRIYERYFGAFRDVQFNMLEIGVQFGLSLMTWAEYFPSAIIHGIDVTPDWKSNDHRVSTWICDQRDRDKLSGLAGKIGPIKLIIDDGCHQADAQIASFEALWPHVQPGGLYIIEDCFTWSDKIFASPKDGYQWLSQRIGDLFLNGKRYHGKPNPEPNVQFSVLETTLDFVHIHRGLVIFGKKS